MGATSTRSRSLLTGQLQSLGQGHDADLLAVGPTRRTSRARMRSLIRGSLAGGGYGCSLLRNGLPPGKRIRTSTEADARGAPFRRTLRSARRALCTSTRTHAVPSKLARVAGWGPQRLSGRRRTPLTSVVPGRLAEVSSLWTPDGEHPVGERREPENEGPRRGTDRGEPDPNHPTSSTRRRCGREIDEARARVAEVPAQRSSPTTPWGCTSWPPSTCRSRPPTWRRRRWPSTPGVPGRGAG